jgi:tetratricopeptide (TPR) repeat protein
MPLVTQQLATEPAAPDLNYLLGASLFRTQQPEKALPYLQSAIHGHSEILPAEAALGLTLVALGKNAEAIPHLKKALALDDDGSLHYSLARAYRAAGEAQLAAEAMQQYQNIQKQNREINDQLAKEAEIKGPSQ